MSSLAASTDRFQAPSAKAQEIGALWDRCVEIERERVEEAYRSLAEAVEAGVAR